jgi:hypothetical protein
VLFVGHGRFFDVGWPMRILSGWPDRQEQKLCGKARRIAAEMTPTILELYAITFGVMQCG